MLNLNSDNIYEVASKKDLDRVKTIIDEYRDKDLLKGYFGVMANSIYNRTRVKNNEILELLIYGAFIEEYSKIELRELNIFKEDMSYYYSEGINEVREARKHPPLFCIIPDSIFLNLISTKNAIGYTWQEYNQAYIQNKAQNIYRQACYIIQQGIKLKIELDVFQAVLRKALKEKINIKGDKISGTADLELIGLNNSAIIEGIRRENKKAQVRFVAVIDEKTTKMCRSLEGQTFYIDDYNTFTRYNGDTGRMQKYKVFGLVIGINLPPITYHFHWCRSKVKYKDIKSLIRDISRRIDKVINVKS